MEITFLVSLLLISLLNTIPFSYGVETISGNKYITQNTTISSPNGRFELGFFKSAQSSNYYVGIWYKNISPITVVWVANRVTPIPSAAIHSSKFRILAGDLVLLDGAQNLVWSTNVSAAKLRSVLATLRDDGNLVLSDDGVDSKTPLWQSVEHPTDTFLPGSKFGYNKRTKTKQVLTSWKTPDDPSPGLYSLDNDGNTAFQLWNGTEEYWNSGPKFGSGILRTLSLKQSPVFNFSVVDNENESYFTYSVIESVISRWILDVNGQQKSLTWLEPTKEWAAINLVPAQQCDVYAYCGPFSICNENSSPLCACLYGFSEKQRGLNESFQGCVRKSRLRCEETERFKMYTNMRLPGHPQNTTAGSEAECESICQKNCSCTAYAYINYCSIWVGQLFNLKQLGKDDSNGSTIYVRLAPSEFPNIQDTNSQHLSGKLKVVIPSIAVAAAALIACAIFYICFKRMRTALKTTAEAMVQVIDEDTDENGIGVQFFTLQSILEATNNFSNANKLGKGGFGPVYKGTLPEGQEIAVKRLSNQSRQGINEFKNEVVLIAKLQHRNLVKLVGYCSQLGEKILLYEYMSNKSLDTFIFDQTRRLLLDWSKRFDIILGIARGLLYLHQDSRLRIIHRDMKTSNVLLDEDMTPKISDFGLARMVIGNALEANTKKVAGTYGYMSPEYALSGLFSIKSDVFSFGVIILEVISGKNNRAFFQNEEISNLLGYAWKLWNEGNIMDLVDDSLHKCCKEHEVLRCINVGLLCIEEDPKCRPTMPNVFSMLMDESMTLPRPNKPAFVTRTQTCNDSSSVPPDKPCSNQLTFSLEGR
ncbi:PREDICTED: G-type lectin S-receptor-like serine/threonine-protein kinase At4g27290 isoform X2 [Ipomoea nil]|uniref:G-type lectin S-receptor-like serine/threonine-protein kinase At4g27290 isoform X2 n=1 Tax=Ipomoea nil TaxID=35883 RepID=UPI000900EFE3|nr:PREDICTED: G-type lectin S-receptor-like serine/threonine-protein kinase At4g27290 isoform X2 [Ipomoea nil]